MINLDSILKRIADKGSTSQSYGFSNSHTWIQELDHKEGWAPKNWWFWNVVLEKTLESFLDCKEIQPVNPKGNQFWIIIGRTGTEAATPILWPPNVKSWLIWKDSDAGKVGGDGDDRGWDGWMALLTRCTWVWVSSRSWWWTGKPGVLQYIGSQRVGHNWETDLNLTWKLALLFLTIIILIYYHHV